MGMLYEYSQEDQDRINAVSVRPTDYAIRSAMAGLIGLVQLLGANTSIDISVRRSLLTNHRFIEAQRVLGLLERQP